MDNEQLTAKLTGLRYDIGGILEQMLMLEREVEILTGEVDLIKDQLKSINDKLEMIAIIILPEG